MGEAKSGDLHANCDQDLKPRLIIRPFPGCAAMHAEEMSGRGAWASRSQMEWVELSFLEQLSWASAIAIGKHSMLRPIDTGK